MSFDLKLALPYLSPAQSAEDTAPLHAFGSLDGPIVRPFSSSLIITYMIDEPGALVFVRERDVEKRHRDELHAQAIANLRAHTARRRLRFESKGAVSQAKLDGQHDASLLLLDELWDPPGRLAEAQGDVIAAVPSRHTLLFSGVDQRGGVNELRAAMSKSAERKLSPELFVRRDRAWQPFLL